MFVLFCLLLSNDSSSGELHLDKYMKTGYITASHLWATKGPAFSIEKSIDNNRNKGSLTLLKLLYNGGTARKYLGYLGISLTPF